MTNLEKMIELTGHEADKKQVMEWAYMNRIWVLDLQDHDPFQTMEASVNHWIENNAYCGDEHENWPRFLDAEYVPGEEGLKDEG